MKIIKVDCCKHCPFRHQNNYCTNEAAFDMDLDDIDIVDQNCPLEDMKEG
jgi:hypothetical protein